MRLLTTAVHMLGVVVVGFALVPPLRAEKPEVVALIDQLVSPNPKPVTGDEDRRVAPYYRTPEGFDTAKQAQVYKARAKLVELGPAAFPYLIERWDDHRYCMTIMVDLSEYCHNRTVGEVCRTIIFDQLQPYGYWKRDGRGISRSKPMRPQYPKAFLASAKDAKAWWEKHKDMSLHAMQLMVVGWIQAEEAKQPEGFTDAERAELQEIRDKLVTSGEFLKPGNYYCVDREFRVESSDNTGK